MKKNRLQIIIVLFVFFVFLSCNSIVKDENSKIVDSKDYQKYLLIKDHKNLDNIDTEITFWQKKYKDAPNQYPYLIKLAGLYSTLFEITGNIGDLYNAEKLLLDCNQRVKETNSGIHRSIAKNYISQHRFKEAQMHLEKAYALGENKKATQKMLFDVAMELGNYKTAESILNENKNFNDFDYLIRLAKWNDHIGDLQNAIRIMEKAMKIVQESKNSESKIWIYTNIADFCGHNGEIEAAYQYYLKALELDNNNMYALKGIAWIAYSHDRDVEKASEIVNYIEKKHIVPDLYLLKADMNQYSDNREEQELALREYFDTLNKNDYGDMYNKYNALLYAEIPDKRAKALEIAQREINNRPTPESYDLLAWTYYNMEEFDKAYEIASAHTIDKTHEPLIVYHNELILKANNKLTKENTNKEDLIASIFELGPNIEKQLRNL
ncbi:tetratricopeptide repeat protein [Flavobacterium sp. U410]|jgi:hypothetical protein